MFLFFFTFFSSLHSGKSKVTRETVEEQSVVNETGECKTGSRFFIEKGLHRALRVHRDAKRRNQKLPNATVPVSPAFPLNGKHVNVWLALRF